jgi:AAA+ superfamily predicted ATPase
MKKKQLLPDWAVTMREIFRAETISQFVLYGNINDLVHHRDSGKDRYISLNRYLADVMFQPFDVVLLYDRGRGISVAKGAKHFFNYLEVIDRFHGTRYAADSGIADAPDKILDSPGLLPREPEKALELLDRFIGSVPTFSRNKKLDLPRSVGVIVDFAHFIVPRGESIYMTGELGANLIKIMNWAENPSIMGANIATVLVTENLTDLSAFITDSPYSAKIQIPFPDKDEIQHFVHHLVQNETQFDQLCEVDRPILAERLQGLSRINIKDLILRALRNQKPITAEFLTQLKKEVIEKEAFGKLEFIESRRTLEDVAGHREAKRWLREDIQLIKKGAVNCLPMGYLIAGRIGTGKTYLVECFAGECGIPFVKLKNFREKWVGATEGNLEKIFSILKALGQVVVFIDEADQATGKRSAGSDDSGLSGRVYGMLAAEMSRTENRGKIFWIFATSRPDLVEVDLKRQGRLDVHIPLFPPEDETGIKELLAAMARKLDVPLREEELPALNFDGPIGGNELEGLLIRTLRQFQLQDPDKPQKTLTRVLEDVIDGFRPSSHTNRLQLMDLLAVKECTDVSFLPPRYRRMTSEEIDRRISELHIL